ncbi:hypothetical protein [Candidatus Cyanaurora vandensis]|uniref:hypothetical protein n=1 Tax=Candidatus Cyanaurora vandensis TaxID=2714958 RepID=UPI00257C9FA3|nr:hypothetical protein [Candidatus Cyanaurora vandensis]
MNGNGLGQLTVTKTSEMKLAIAFQQTRLAMVTVLAIQGGLILGDRLLLTVPYLLGVLWLLLLFRKQLGQSLVRARLLQLQINAPRPMPTPAMPVQAKTKKLDLKARAS